MYQSEANRNPWAGYRMGPSPTTYVPRILKPGVEKSPFQISVNRLEVVENVNLTPFRIYWLAVK